MKEYVIVEHLKTRRTTLRKMICFVPLLCILITTGFNAMGGPEILQLTLITVLNHWALLWMPALIALLAGLSHNLEKKSTQYKTLFSFPIDLGISWLAKNTVLAMYSFLASVFLTVFILLLKLTIISESIDIVPLYNYLIALFLCWVLTLWQIPLCLWMAKKTNFFVVILINCALNLELGAGLAPTKFWWISPWSWSLRLEAPLLHLHPNGIPLDSSSHLLNSFVIPVGIMLSVFLFVLVIFVTSRLFQKQEVR